MSRANDRPRKLRVPAALALALAGVAVPFVAVSEFGGCTGKPPNLDADARHDGAADVVDGTDGRIDAAVDSRPDALADAHIADAHPDARPDARPDATVSADATVPPDAPPDAPEV